MRIISGNHKGKKFKHLKVYQSDQQQIEQRKVSLIFLKTDTTYLKKILDLF